MNKRYRIYIGSENIKGIHRAFDMVFDCYTVTKSTGVWHGSIEVCYVVEIIGDEKLYNQIFNMCAQLRKDLNQEAIMMTDEHVHTQMI